MAERVDVCIVGSGFGGSISAFRLAELYRAAGPEPEHPGARARAAPPAHRLPPVDGHRDLLAAIYGLVQGDGAADRGRQRRRRRLEPLPGRVAARRPPRPSSAATTAPTTGRDRRMWPARSAAQRSTPTTRARSRRCACSARPGSRSSKSGGLWAATLNAAGHTCDRVPLAIDLGRCIQAKWCHTGCIFARQELGDHELPRVGRGARRAGPAELRGRADRGQSRRGPTATW